MAKVIICRIGEDPKVEDVEKPFWFTQHSLLNGGYVMAKLIVVGDARVVAYWDEDGDRKNLPFNRNVPAMALPPAIEPTFVVDTRKSPPEAYAAPGEMGYFPIKGNFLITKADKHGDHIDLDQSEIDTLVPLLTLPKCKRCKVKPLAYAGAIYCGAGCSARAEAGE